jgi:NADH-quinone oxidoreductase subunit M
MQLPWLTILTFLPLVGALAILAARSVSKEGAAVDGFSRWIALFTTLVVAAFSLVVAQEFFAAGVSADDADFRLVERVGWFAGLEYHLGLDGVSLALVLLTTLLMPLCILASWKSIDKQVSAYFALFLLLETLMIGVFCALDLFLFYVFFEGGLIPMFIIIGVWGGARRVYAAFKFFLYTLLGSVLMLVAMIVMVLQAGTTSIPDLMTYPFAADLQVWLWLAFFASFAVKMPMWPVHTWLPDAHVEAPTAGSVVLAAILLKMGGYGFMRFSLPMFPDASHLFAPLVFALSVIAIVYASLVAFRQTDVKKLIAYSSVAHMGFVTMGLFSGNEQGIQGAMFQMISHGVVSGALFLCVGVVYDRMHTREIAFYGGLVNRMPIYATLFMLFTMANVGLPGTSGFVGEFMTMLGAFQANAWVAAGAALGVILSAVYGLPLYRRMVFGEITNPKLADIRDVTALELLVFVPLVVATLVLGIYPSFVLDLTAPAVDALVQSAASIAGN